MNRTLKATITAVLLGTATLAVAQSPAESFADYLRRSQALVGPHFKPRPTFSNAPRTPVPGLSIRDYQATSSDSPAWQLDQGKVHASKESTFAQTHPHGLPLAAYQAYSSDSLQFKLPPDSNMPAFATADGATVAKQAATPTRRTGVEPTAPTMSSRSN